VLKTFFTIRQKQTHNNWTLTTSHKVKHFNMSPDSISAVLSIVRTRFFVTFLYGIYSFEEKKKWG
jgi:hypothetical protein